MRTDNIVEIRFAINQLSTRVQLFKQKSQNEWSMRCPVCGDSQKSKTKARGSIYLNSKGNYSYHCFNCAYSASVQQFLKEMFSDIYQQYRLAIFKDKPSNENNDILKKKYAPDSDKFDFSLTEPVFEVPIASKYLKTRCIPELYWDTNFLYCNKIGSFIKSNRTDGKYDKISDSGDWLITPIIGESEFNKKVVQAVCCRNLDNASKMRYIHAKLRDDCIDDQVIWGLYNIDSSKPVIACEGIFDAILLDNAIALLTSVKTVKNRDDWNIIYLIDNEPRNKEIVKIVERHISAGRTISLLPNKYLKFGKDINDYIKSGIAKEQIMDDIIKHTYNGARAFLEFNNWRKI